MRMQAAPGFESIVLYQITGGLDMIAKFHYNIPRHHGKYGTAVSVFNSREDMRDGLMPIAYFKTYKHQKTDDDRVCDGDRQINDLKTKVLKNFPDVEFINL